MSALIDSFIDYLRLERAYSPRTVQSYEMDLNEFEAYLRRTDADLTLATADADNVRNWTMEMMEAGQKETSVNRRLSALRSFYRYLLRKGVVEVSPMQTVRGPKKRKPLPYFLREEEMDNLLKEENFGYEFQGERDRLILMMFYEMGLRRAELVGLNEGDVDFYRDQIKVTGKRNKQRLIPFGDELKSALQSYMALKAQEVSAPEDGALFVQKNGRRVTDAWVYTMVRRNLTKVTSIKKRSPHVLRHTFATTMLNHDAELEAVKELLGHESVATTEIYTHTTFEELKNAYSKAHPRARK